MTNTIPVLFAIAVFSALLASPVSGQDEPALPAGLAEQAEPGAGLQQDIPGPAPEMPFDVRGFWDVRAGARISRDPHEKRASLAETRLQLRPEKQLPSGIVKVTTDFLYDAVPDDHRIEPEKGLGWLDLREASFLLTPADFADIKAGRQILTWGTGDLVFINDMFPKDWNSFFIGRDQEYLKAPSDAFKASFYTDFVNMDAVYTPRFDADRYIDGRRISYWDGNSGDVAGRNAVVEAEEPGEWFEDDEVAIRFFKNIGGNEVALYGYRGFWKSPGGTNALSGKATFPRLSAWGASARGNMFKGIGNLETGYYDSRDDRNGMDPLVRNGELRFLAGYEREIATDFTSGLQFYLEHTLDHDGYRRTLPGGGKASDEDRIVLTLRLTKLMMSQDFKVSVFTYYSPTDQDAFVMPNMHYKMDDHWSIEAGGNVFLGEDKHTFFGQFEKNTNVYVGTRYSF